MIHHFHPINLLSIHSLHLNVRLLYLEQLHIYKKSVGVQFSSFVPRIEALEIAFVCQINNAEAHAICIDTAHLCHKYTPMSVLCCLVLTDVQIFQISMRQAQSVKIRLFIYTFSHPLDALINALPTRGIGRRMGQSYKIKLKREKGKGENVLNN